MSMLANRPFAPALRFFFGRLFPVPFILVGAVLLFIGVRNLMLSRDSASWPSVEGVVIDSDVEYHRSTGTGENRSRGSYHAEVVYDFTVGDNDYSGDRVSFGDYGSSDRAHARNIVKRYPAGKTVTVYYKPGDPETCVLETGTPWGAYFLPSFGVVFLGAGVLMAIFVPKLIRSDETLRTNRVTDITSSDVMSPPSNIANENE